MANHTRKPTIAWTAPASLWPELVQAQTNGENGNARVAFRQPAIMRFKSDTFMEEFMALLELVRLKRVAIQQLEAFGPIYLMLRSESD